METMIMQALNMIIGASPIVGLILMILGGLVTLGTVYVATTPSQTDDNWLKNLESKPVIKMITTILRRFSPVQKK